MRYNKRENCVFCQNPLICDYFENDKQCFSGHYGIDKSDKFQNIKPIPFNVSLCSNCNTPQLKYLADINEVYKTNHADSTGLIMNTLHKKNLDLILKYKESINNIVEIGSSKGVLADIILSNIDTKYFIIEPSYFGHRENKIIINDYYENVEDQDIDANTMIISHVFEHFYEPLKILDKIQKNKNIENLFLVFPDLEHYINNNVLHVLNTEHTFYVDNDFLINLFFNYGFELVESINHENHSVLFYFKRYNIDKPNKKLYNKNYNLDNYYNKISTTVENFNKKLTDKKNKKSYLWPSSIHTLYLFIFGLDEKLIDGFLDNSPNKIGKKMYGTNLEVFDYKEIYKKNDVMILKNGGIFNKEID